MAIIMLRTLIIYLALLLSMRMMGKRQIGELEISELVTVQPRTLHLLQSP